MYKRTSPGLLFTGYELTSKTCRYSYTCLCKLFPCRSLSKQFPLNKGTLWESYFQSLPMSGITKKALAGTLAIWLAMKEKDLFFTYLRSWVSYSSVAFPAGSYCMPEEGKCMCFLELLGWVASYVCAHALVCVHSKSLISEYYHVHVSPRGILLFSFFVTVRHIYL